MAAKKQSRGKLEAHTFTSHSRAQPPATSIKQTIGDSSELQIDPKANAGAGKPAPAIPQKPCSIQAIAFSELV
jgi:hypothetical protein